MIENLTMKREEFKTHVCRTCSICYILNNANFCFTFYLSNPKAFMEKWLAAVMENREKGIPDMKARELEFFRKHFCQICESNCNGVLLAQCHGDFISQTCGGIKRSIGTAAMREMMGYDFSGEIEYGTEDYEVTSSGETIETKKPEVKLDIPFVFCSNSKAFNKKVGVLLANRNKFKDKVSRSRLEARRKTRKKASSSKS